MKCSVLMRLIEHILAAILLRKKHVFGFFLALYRFTVSNGLKSLRKR